jgi:hypothetical protein
MNEVKALKGTATRIGQSALIDGFITLGHNNLILTHEEFLAAWEQLKGQHAADSRTANMIGCAPCGQQQ